jgi:NAD(P)-dependent dehydrogenase (short-subunit alcohol dehydrogenase family)
MTRGAGLGGELERHGRLDVAFDNDDDRDGRGVEPARPGVVDRIVAGTPLARAARPEEIAESAAWLLSDRASFVPGAVLPVTGGTAV